MRQIELLRCVEEWDHVLSKSQNNNKLQTENLFLMMTKTRCILFSWIMFTPNGVPWGHHGDKCKRCGNQETSRGQSSILATF